MALPRAPLAVVFDMDGLIFDSESLYRDAMVAAAAVRGHDMPLPLFLSMVGLPGADSRAVMLGHFGPDFDVDAFWAASSEHFYEMAKSQLALKTGVVELLDTLDALNLPRAIATSSRHQDAEHHLAHAGIRERFHAVIAQGDYANGKPAPDPFLAAAERLGVSPENCLALEDSHNGVRAAASAGMMTIMVPDLLSPTEEIEALCRHIAADLHEVEVLVREAWRDR
ncbi:MAG: family hydrolase [Caulobacter sp.]|nr:family hydrolase [Caulobacter sp.]